MFNVYDKCSSIFLNDGRVSIKFEYTSDIQDFDDYIVIKTPVTIADVDRGWRGDLTFWFSGYDVKDEDEDEVTDYTILKDVLCSARKFNLDDDAPVVWEYKFLKH